MITHYRTDVTESLQAGFLVNGSCGGGWFRGVAWVDVAQVHTRQIVRIWETPVAFHQGGDYATSDSSYCGLKQRGGRQEKETENRWKWKHMWLTSVCLLSWGFAYRGGSSETSSPDKQSQHDSLDRRGSWEKIRAPGWCLMVRLRNLKNVWCLSLSLNERCFCNERPISRWTDAEIPTSVMVLHSMTKYNEPVD